VSVKTAMTSNQIELLSNDIKHYIKSIKSIGQNLVKTSGIKLSCNIKLTWIGRR